MMIVRGKPGIARRDACEYVRGRFSFLPAARVAVFVVGGISVAECVSYSARSSGGDGV